jgi:hypothetical protein
MSLSFKKAVASAANITANNRQIKVPRTLIGKRVNVQMATCDEKYIEIIQIFS